MTYLERLQGFNLVVSPVPPFFSATEPQLHFLSEKEKFDFKNLKFSARKSTYWIGRFVAKKAVSLSHPEVALSEIQISNSKSPKDFGVPLVFLQSTQKSIGHLSLSHCAQYAAACFHPEIPVGIDVEMSDERDVSFLEFNFTEKELAIIRSLPHSFYQDASTLLWTAKEAMSKVLGKGLSIPTLSLECHLNASELLQFLKKVKNQLYFTGTILMQDKTICFSIQSKILDSHHLAQCFLSLAIQSEFLMLKNSKEYLNEY